MASRSKSLQKLDAGIRALSKRAPEWKDVHDLLFGFMKRRPNVAARDRAAALGASALVEHALQQAIRIHLRKEITETELKSLFGSSSAPLSTFHAKIVLARALGIISNADQQELDTIRNIRNAFAHSITLIRFNDEAIRDRCLKLRITKAFGNTKSPSAPRRIYVSAVATIFFDLIDYCDGMGDVLAAATTKT